MDYRPGLREGIQYTDAYMCVRLDIFTENYATPQQSFKYNISALATFKVYVPMLLDAHTECSLEIIYPYYSYTSKFTQRNLGNCTIYRIAG